MAILQITINLRKADLVDVWFSNWQPKGNWVVDWGDGCIEVNTEHHDYKKLGTYQITARGDFVIEQLGLPSLTISLDRIEDCGVASLEDCFYRCEELKSVPHDWDVSNVIDMTDMFYGCSSFNQDLSHWGLEGMYTRYMFDECPIEDKHKPKGVK